MAAPLLRVTQPSWPWLIRTWEKQEHPGTGRTLAHQPTGKVVIEDSARSLGIKPQKGYLYEKK
jgi:hypothetical protein